VRWAAAKPVARLALIPAHLRPKDSDESNHAKKLTNWTSDANLAYTLQTYSCRCGLPVDGDRQGAARNAARAALAKENHYALEPLARCTGRKSGR
jgi:hypothetical protein